MEATEQALFRLIAIIGAISVITLILVVLYMQGYIVTKSVEVSQHNEAMLIGLLNHTHEVEKGTFNTTEMNIEKNNSQVLGQILDILNKSK